MTVSKRDVSYGSGKSYDRIVNICNGDDIWITTEFPQEVEEESVDESQT